MEDGVLSVARALLDNKVVVQRPPSGLRDKKSLARNYQKELSDTSRYKSDQVELLNQPIGAHKDRTARRVQSARARRDSDSTSQDSTSTADLKSRRIRSAHPKLSGNSKKHVQRPEFRDLLSIENFELTFEESVGKHTGRPDSAKSTSSDTDTTRLKPSVYALDGNRRVYGSEPDLSVKDSSQSFPFKLSNPISRKDISDKKKIKTKRSMACSVIHHNGRPIPTSLLPLVPWLQADASSDITGVEANKCLVFLPCLSTDSCNDLPTVPSLQHVDDELPYHEVVYKPPAPWKPKKYKHPSWDHVYDEFKHSKRRHSEIFSDDGRLLHVPQKTERSADIIKREIRVLENLLKGVGTLEGQCVVAHYQAEITNLHTMAGETLAMVDERPKTPEPADLTGLRAFYRQHDEVITKIKLEHQLCMEELAKLEETGDAFISYTENPE